MVSRLATSLMPQSLFTHLVFTTGSTGMPLTNKTSPKKMFCAVHIPPPPAHVRARTHTQNTHTHTIRQHTHRHTHLHTHLANRRIGTHLANIRMRTLCRWLPLHGDRVVLSVSEEGRARETNVFRNLDILSW
jgi:hypothetical protein